MNGEEIQLFLSKFPCLIPHFKGIYFIDQLPKVLKNGDFLICNTDTHDGRGIHWIAFVSFKNFLECFDSLGIDGNKQTLLLNFCNFKNKKQIHYNETAFQQLDSDTCGKFVLYFIVQRYFNLDLDFEDLLKETFFADLSKNEELIDNFIKEYGNDN